jgi:hypothetical protein
VGGPSADKQTCQRLVRAGLRLKAIVTAEVYRKVGAPMSRAGS